MCYPYTESGSSKHHGLAVMRGVGESLSIMRKEAEQYIWEKSNSTRVAGVTYKIWVNRFDNFVKKPVKQITREDFHRFKVSVQDTYAPANVKFGLFVVKNYLRFLQESGKVDPQKVRLSTLSIPKARSRSHYAITEEEHRLLIKTIQESYSRESIKLQREVLFELLHDTGMRINELLRVTVDQIGPERQAIIDTEKTHDSRVVFWTINTDRKLREYLEYRNELENRGPYLFCSMRDTRPTPLTPRSVQRLLDGLVKKAGIKNNLVPHSYRHAYIHRLALARVPDSIIARLVGHSTPHTVFTYTKLIRPELQEVYSSVFESLSTLSGGEMGK